MPYIPIPDPCFNTPTPHLPYYLSQVNPVLQEERIYNEVVQRQVFFWFYRQKMSKKMHFLLHKCIFL